MAEFNNHHVRCGIASFIILLVALGSADTIDNMFVSVVANVQESDTPKESLSVWSISLLRDDDTSYQSYWIGVQNLDTVPRVICIESVWFRVYGEPPSPSYGGMTWFSIANTCGPTSSKRHLINPRQTLFERVVINFDEIPSQEETSLKFSLFGYDYGPMKGDLDAEQEVSDVELSWSGIISDVPLERPLPDSGKAIGPPRAGKPFDKQTPGSVARDSWSPVVIRDGIEGEAWKYWVGVKNMGSVARTILSPNISYEVTQEENTYRDGEVERDEERNIRRIFLVLPGETLFTKKYVSAGGTSLPTSASLSVEIALDEVTLDLYKVVSKERKQLNWAGDINGTR